MMMDSATRQAFLRTLELDQEFRSQIRQMLQSNETPDLPELFSKFTADTTSRLEALEAGQDRLERNQQQTMSLLGDLLDSTALRAAHAEAFYIAEDLGCSVLKALTAEELRQLARDHPRRDIASNQRRSFERADLVIALQHPDGATSYAAVEAAYTADHRDTNRAIRNAHYLRRFTGQHAIPVIAAARMDPRILNLIDCKAVRWHQLEPQYFPSQ